ncbi:hypothetical protein BGW38_008869, partial [Lunasporangiospora selenospora]
MIEHWREKLQDIEELVLYSDGSLKDYAKENMKMTFGVVVQGWRGHYEVISGTVRGFASWAKAELIGLLNAILCCSRGKDVMIKLDNSAVEQGFQDL